MEDFTQLAITCKQMNMECKEPYIQKLKKAKHAAHQANYRLKQSIKKLHITVTKTLHIIETNKTIQTSDQDPDVQHRTGHKVTLAKP